MMATKPNHQRMPKEAHVMDKNLVIELTLRPVDADRSDDTAGYGIVVHEKQQPRRMFRLIPIVIPGFNPQPDPPVAAQGQDVRGFTNAAAARCHDVAGHALQTGITPTPASSQVWQLAPGLALKLTLPDPAPEVTVNPGDVRGFMMKEKLKEPGDPDSAGYTNGAPIGWAFSFISDPFGTFVNVAVTGKP